VTWDAPPGRPGALTDAGRIVGIAALGGTVAFVGLVTICQLLAMAQFLLVGAFGLWSWAKIGLLTALLSLRADVITRVTDLPILRTADPMTVRWRFVPMLLTIGFLWVAARAGRRAARTRPGRSPLAASGLAAAGAGVPVAILSAFCAALVTLVLPALGLRMHVDVLSAALWAGVLAATGAGTGAYLEAARGRVSAAFRGGLTAYGWALGLLAVGVFVLATLEPTVTRDYVEGVTGVGAGGAVLVGAHLLAFPAQSALLLAPASGSCLELIGEGPMFDLCPWRLVASGPAGEVFLPEALPLSPWLWLLDVAPFVAAMLGGRRAVTGTTTSAWRAAGTGVGVGVCFASLVAVGGWFAAPQISPILAPVPTLSLHPEWVRTAIMSLTWGIAGGAIGAIGASLAARRYEDPELPRPTSA
jgi:hypothetical protein